MPISRHSFRARDISMSSILIANLKRLFFLYECKINEDEGIYSGSHVFVAKNFRPAYAFGRTNFTILDRLY